MFIRCLLLATILSIGHLLVGHVEDGYSFGSVVPPANDFDDIPLQFDSWNGIDRPEDQRDPRLREFLQEREGIDRTYSNTDTGHDVTVHAIWTDDYIKIHFPEQCYRETGWALIATSNSSIEKPNGETFPAKLLKFHREGSTKYVLYWFQLGDNYFFDRWRHRALRREVCWGEKEWPPLMKFMLETDAPEESTSRAALEQIASHLHTAINAPAEANKNANASVTSEE